MQIFSKELNFSYNPKAKTVIKALDNVNLTINSGDFFGIVGHTGSGKTTFVQHLNALLTVQEGELWVGEYELSKKIIRKREKLNYKQLRSKVGMVFQYPEYQLFDQTVFLDVAFGLRNFFPKMSEEEKNTRVFAALEKVGLSHDIAEKSPFDLSGGQKRRVAIAGVIVSEPEVLVLDEPAAGLDPKGKRELFELLHRLNDGGKRTIIIVSHDMNDIVENCNNMAIFSKGKILKSGKPKELFNDIQLIEEAELELPTVAYLQNELRKCNIFIDTDLTVDKFVTELLKIK